MGRFFHGLLDFFIFVDRIFAAIVRFLLILIMLSMAAFVVTQVVLRNVFNSGITWADVASRHMVLWVAFLGAMLATRERQHISIDILTRFIPRISRNVVRIFLDAFAMIASFFLAKASLAFVMAEKAMGAELFIGIPIWTVETIIPFGFTMISIEYAIGIALDIWRISTHGSQSFEAGRGRG